MPVRLVTIGQYLEWLRGRISLARKKKLTEIITFPSVQLM